MNKRLLLIFGAGGGLMKKLGFVALALIAGMSILGNSSDKEIEGNWEQPKDFSGWVSVRRKADFKSTMPSEGESVEITARDDSYAYFHVTGTEWDGAYSWPVGTVNGRINMETKAVAKASGVGVKTSFSGDINQNFNAQESPILGPTIRINKKIGRYYLEFACPSAEGEYSQVLLPSGTPETHERDLEICVPLASPYNDSDQGGAGYDPSQGIISGQCTVTMYAMIYNDVIHDGTGAVLDKDDPGLQSLPEWDKCPVEYEVSWNFKIKKEKYKVRIIKPGPDEEFVFWDPPIGAYIPAQAKADPESHDDEIQPWFIDPIQGSEPTTNPAPPVGPKVSFQFAKLPADNDQFGRKKIYADNADPVEIKVFFEKTGQGNPGELGHPNWFYYWRQGVVTGMDDFDYDGSIDYYGYFDETSGKLALGDLAADTEEDESLSLLTPRGRLVFFFPETKGVDTCARTVVHELKHKEIFDEFAARIAKANAQTPAGYWCDFDFDGIPDVIEKVLEPELGIKWYNPDTHNLGKIIDKEYRDYGDQELLCWLAERGARGIYEKDWAWPGKQSTPKE